MLQRFLNALYVVFAFFFGAQTCLLAAFGLSVIADTPYMTFGIFALLTLATFTMLFVVMWILAMWVGDIIFLHNKLLAVSDYAASWQGYLFSIVPVLCFIVMGVVAAFYLDTMMYVIDDGQPTQGYWVLIQTVSTCAASIQLYYSYRRNHRQYVIRNPRRDVVTAVPLPVLKRYDTVRVHYDIYKVWYEQRYGATHNYNIPPQDFTAYTVFEVVEVFNDELRSLTLVEDATDKTNAGIVPTTFLYQV